MDVVDAFCGAGGFSAGAMAVGCRVTTGVDRDSVPLKLWAANTGGRAVNATIGRDPVPWPDARPGLHVHFSPECTPLSKARSGGASQGEVDAALDAVRACLDGEEVSNCGGEGGDEGCDEGGSEYTGEEGQIICRNMSVQLQQQASLLVGPSHITAAGWGVFSSASLEKGDFLSECASSDNPCPSTRHRPLAFLPTPNLPMHPPTTAMSRFHPAYVSAARQVHGRGHLTGGG